MAGARAGATGVAVAVALICAPVAGAGPGSFFSSDNLLNRIWIASVQTAQDMLAPGPLTVDAGGAPCEIDLPTVILDGNDRDRCPYIGDEAVEGMTLLVSTPSAQAAMRNELVWFANAQPGNGSIPASPIFDNTVLLFDYPSYWVQCLYDYVLYTGDVALGKQLYPNLVALIDKWYPAQARSDGLLVNNLGIGDYAFVHRQGKLVAYFNAGYALALEHAAALAGWTGNAGKAKVWTAREAALVAPFNSAFFDPAAGAYVDTPTAPTVHPQDGNAFAILAGLASPAQATSALNYLAANNTRPWGNTIADNDTWDDPGWGFDTQERAYPFISYFEVLARFGSSLDDSAIDLIRREWGWMLDRGPATAMWEDIGPDGGGPRDLNGSWDHGWSSGAAPALTSYVLGVRPTSPGFTTFVVDPHPGTTITSASGSVPTPNGDLAVSWTLQNGKPVISVTAPKGEVWANAPNPPAVTKANAEVRKANTKAKSNAKAKVKQKQKPKPPAKKPKRR